jgi:DNA-binding transcriptional LysR family regulator
MTATLSPTIPPSTRRRTLALTAAGVVVASAATSIVALTVTALGVADGFAPLRPAVYVPFVAIGVIATVIGWQIIRSQTANPGAVLRVLVPSVLIASFIPDTILIVTGFIPGTTLVGGLSLSVMHVIVAAVALPIAQRIAPVGAKRA